MVFPSLPRAGLGVGLDLPWDGASGFGRDPARGDVIAPPLRSFLARHAASWSHAFFSWQPRDRAPPRLADYEPAWADLVAALPPELPRALHHTALDLGALGPCRRGELLAFTAQLCEHFGLRWVNEDIGLWSLDGRPLPYPLPPLLDEEGLRATIANVAECQRGLPVPLVLEFPGFSRGSSVVLGDWHPYDFFRELARETAAPVTLDTGHLLSWQWWRGRRGEDLLADLDRLPLDHCFEIHLSGCEIVGDLFVDAHHGQLLGEQLDLLARLRPLCPHLRAITFEDPRFDPRGALLPPSAASWQRLGSLLAAPTPPPPASAPPASAPPASAPPVLSRTAIRPAICPALLPALAERARGQQREEALGALLFGARELAEAAAEDPIFSPLVPSDLAAVRAEVRGMIRRRVYRGSGGLESWFPATLAAWRASCADEDPIAALIASFCASPACAAWRELPAGAPGLSLEEAFHRFFEEAGVGDAATREEEFLGAVLRSLAVTPRASFVWPAAVRSAPGGCFALSRQHTLHAALDGRFVRGAATPLIGAILSGSPLAVSPQEAAPVRQMLVSLRLLAPG